LNEIKVYEEVFFLLRAAWVGTKSESEIYLWNKIPNNRNQSLKKNIESKSMLKKKQSSRNQSLKKTIESKSKLKKQSTLKNDVNRLLTILIGSNHNIGLALFWCLKFYHWQVKLDIWFTDSSFLHSAIFDKTLFSRLIGLGPKNLKNFYQNFSILLTSL
jgi:hypothetical protein